MLRLRQKQNLIKWSLFFRYIHVFLSSKNLFTQDKFKKKKKDALQRWTKEKYKKHLSMSMVKRSPHAIFHRPSVPNKYCSVAVEKQGVLESLK